MQNIYRQLYSTSTLILVRVGGLCITSPDFNRWLTANRIASPLIP